MVRAFGFDCELIDGKIGGIVESVEPGEVRVQITSARASGEALRADKGINLPDTKFRLPSGEPAEGRRDIGSTKGTRRGRHAAFFVFFLPFVVNPLRSGVSRAVR